MGYKNAALGYKSTSAKLEVVPSKRANLSVVGGALTDAACKELTAQAKVFKTFDGKGLFLLVHPNGGKYWRMKYHFMGVEKVFAIGVYPQVSLTEARAECARARDLLSQGKDPSIQRRVARMTVATAQATDFAGVADAWFKKQAPGWVKKHASVQRSRLDTDILPELGKLPIREIQAPHVLMALRKIEARGAYEVAARCRSIISQIFRFAIAESKADSDPAGMLQDALVTRPPIEHMATIPASEMPAFFDALNKVPAEDITKLALYWLILTAGRTGEMRFANWGEMEEAGKVWRIPAPRMKMNQEHLVPYSKQATEVLKQAKAMRQSDKADALVFPGFTRHGALSENALLALLARAGYFGRQTSHGFRSSFSTWANENADADPDTIEACLAHSKKGVRGVYNRAKYIQQRRVLLQAWADQCTAWGMKLPNAK